MIRSDDALRAQQLASRPDYSTWVEANAGSGKTTVLSNRVARLLLHGCEPQKILCLTFTKAAAAEMQSRLFAQLGKWSMLSVAELRGNLVSLGERESELTAAILKNARTLFAAALEAPGGLKIQTIHSFCDAVLRRFPLEAETTPRYKLLDDSTKRRLVAEVISAIADGEEFRIFDAVAINMSAADDSIFDLAKQILSRRQQFDAGFDEEWYRQALALPQQATLESLYLAVLGTDTPALLQRMQVAIEQSGSNGILPDPDIERILNSIQNPATQQMFEDKFLFKEKAKVPFGPKPDSWASADIRNKYPEISELASAMAQRIADGRPKRLALRTLQTTKALYEFAAEFLHRYDQKKSALGLLDFDDQIQKVRKLLSAEGVARWVMYKLDAGISHILVDEAQDTSPVQWDVIKSLTDDFFSGAGSHVENRTIFVVGDEKQSIYSFLGADPDGLNIARTHFEKMLRDMAQPIENCSLLYSFRSAQPILQLVDAVMQKYPANGNASEVTHLSPDREKPGRIELWHRSEKNTPPVAPPWFDPSDMQPEDKPLVQLARRVADWIEVQLREAIIPEGDINRRLRAGDILILVQKRGPLFKALMAEMKARNLPLAGADRFKPQEELAVKDIVAALTFVATPFDDLSLAAALRSPLCGLSESDLFSLAHDRGSTSLWERLLLRRAEFAEAVEMFERLRGSEGFLSVYEMLEILLTNFDGRKKLVARLGVESIEGIDELLAQSLEYESVEAPGLIRFLDWIARSDEELQRQPSARQNLIRLMTVHGAKGQESPLVILPDTAVTNANDHKSRLYKLTGAHSAWGPIADGLPDFLLEAKAKEIDRAQVEKQRLLYVAMTRAEHWLVVCGADGKTAPDLDWYDQIKNALTQSGVNQGNQDLVISHNWPMQKKLETADDLNDPVGFIPDWATEPVPSPEKRRAILSPSQLGGAHSTLWSEPDFAEDDRASKRGRWIHTLLEHLPKIAASKRHESAGFILQYDPEPPEQDALADIQNEVGKILAAPHLAPLFAENSLGEVPFKADLLENQLSGRIDRLIVTQEKISVVDFKSNADVPTQPEAVPEGILRQLGAYAFTMKKIWPDRQIETSILWTRTAELMVLPQNIVMDAFARREKP